jgi:hypothetical protein
LFLLGVSANGFAILTGLYDEGSYWPGPDGSYDYGDGISENWGAGLGVYQGTADGNWSEPETVAFFTGLGYADVTLTDLTITNTGYAGTWAVNDPIPAENYVDFLIVKGGTALSVHGYSADTYGTWNVGWLPDAGGSGNPPQMSHVSGIYTGSPSVPEPATVLLLGAGFLGLALLRRRRARTKA